MSFTSSSVVITWNKFIICSGQSCLSSWRGNAQSTPQSTCHTVCFQLWSFQLPLFIFHRLFLAVFEAYQCPFSGNWLEMAWCLVGANRTCSQYCLSKFRDNTRLDTPYEVGLIFLAHPWIVRVLLIGNLAASKQYRSRNWQEAKQAMHTTTVWQTHLHSAACLWNPILHLSPKTQMQSC